MALPTGLSMEIAMGGCAVRPVLRTQEGKISKPPALVAAIVAAAEDRRPQEASPQAEEAVEAAVVRPAVPDQVMGVAAALAVVA